MTRVVIAARGGPASKSRCADALDGAARSALTRVMLQDMLAAAAQATGVSEIWVVTPTRALAELAREAGARIVRQDRPGLNAAFGQALDELAALTPQGRIALLPGDLPLLDPAELEQAIGLSRKHDVVLAPALDGGTGAIVMRPRARFPLAFGRGSFGRHERAVHGRGLSLAVFTGRTLGVDVDRPEDLQIVLQRGPATQTAAFLRQALSPDPANAPASRATG